jgi:hypothetical protein
MIPLLALFKVRVLFQNIAEVNAAFQLLLGRLHVLDSHQFVNEFLLLGSFIFSKIKFDRVNTINLNDLLSFEPC